MSSNYVTSSQKHQLRPSLSSQPMESPERSSLLNAQHNNINLNFPMPQFSERINKDIEICSNFAARLGVDDNNKPLNQSYNKVIETKTDANSVSLNIDERSSYTSCKTSATDFSINKHIAFRSQTRDKQGDNGDGEEFECNEDDDGASDHTEECNDEEIQDIMMQTESEKSAGVLMGH